MPEQALILTPAILLRLSALRSEPKFHGDSNHLYPGAPTEEIRVSAEKAVNAMLDRLQVGLPTAPQKSYVLSEFLEMLKNFKSADTEERERACTYCERVMESLGISSSDGVLNTWLYGFEPTQKPKRKDAANRGQQT
jgi:hypothetical protein